MKRTLMFCAVLLGLAASVSGLHGQGSALDSSTYHVGEYEPGKAFVLTGSQTVVGFSCSGNGRTIYVKCYVLTVSH